MTSKVDYETLSLQRLSLQRKKRKIEAVIFSTTDKDERLFEFRFKKYQEIRNQIQEVEEEIDRRIEHIPLSWVVDGYDVNS
jgi:dsDNA-specific endonuclease/ATPase MutS2